ncbi:tubulin-specific chaperone E-like [Lineus longissimus]|uniref:tubulin-specific chaperone E-like n=1 Tax=Lineus longissimus TaxID=88925 RepID=UPI002B4F26A7
MLNLSELAHVYMMVDAIPPEVKVGSRVYCDGHYSTVLYIGEVPPTEGVWLGIEWDEPSRGKHDGTHNNNRYFTTRHPNSGSFVRPKKVEFGVTCFEAIQERYGVMDDVHAGVIQEELYVKGTSKNTVVEMVGAQKVNLQQGQLNLLKEAGIRGCKVYGAGPRHNLSMKTPNLRDLDISKTLLPSWEEVARITTQLKHLTSLNVSDNRLQLPRNPDLLAKAFQKLKTLYLNRMDLNFSEVLACSDLWPKLETLHLCYNNINKLCPLDGKLQNLEFLNLEGNSLENWDELLHFGRLPRLETIIANNIGLKGISFPNTPLNKKTGYFLALRVLSVNNNQLSQWSDINELNKLSQLEELRIKHNPVEKLLDLETTREFIIAKIAKLKLLNRSDVFPKERKGSEIDYLKKFGKEWLTAGGNQDPEKNKPNQQFLLDHPRYQDIVDLYGAPEDSEMTTQSKTLKDNLIMVTIVSQQAPDKKPLVKKLPSTMTVQKLKTLVQRLFKADMSSLSLSYISKKMEGPTIELENDLRQLSYYSIENGDTIQVKW